MSPTASFNKRFRWISGISNCTPSKMWIEITYPLRSFSACIILPALYNGFNYLCWFNNPQTISQELCIRLVLWLYVFCCISSLPMSFRVIFCTISPHFTTDFITYPCWFNNSQTISQELCTRLVLWLYVFCCRSSLPMSFWVTSSGPFYYIGLTLIPAWISNYIHYQLRGATDEV